MPTEYLKQINAWRAEMEERLRGPYSWLTLAGLFWLKEGENSLGSGAQNAVLLPDRAPSSAGILSLTDGKVTLQVADGVQARLNESEAKSGKIELGPDRSERPDYVYFDDMRMLVLKRGEQFAIRVWDPQHVNRAHFGGREWYTADAAFRVTAKVEPYNPPKQVILDDITGIRQPAEMHAALAFAVDGHEMRLDAERMDDGSYYLLFKDGTAGHGTYPGGRFLVTEIAEGDRVVMDLNKAYNAPCAFTEYATCPVPMPQNQLTTPILAGEKFTTHA
jgi:uncharacterized protein (DUF1684 family)